MSTILDRLADPGIVPYWYLYVEEADHYFSSIDLGLGRDDQTVCLDPSGLNVADSIIDRKAGVGGTKTMTVRLGPQQSERLTTLLSSTQNGEPGIYLAGRLAYLCMGLMDHNGAMLDTPGVVYSPGSVDPPDHQMVIFAGPIESIQPNPDWHSWSVTMQSLEALLDTRLGYDSIEGSLAPILPGERKHTDWWAIPANQGANRVRFFLSLSYGGSSLSKLFDLALTGSVGRLQVMAAMETAINNYLVASGVLSARVNAVFVPTSGSGWNPDPFGGGNPNEYRMSMQFWWDPGTDPQPDEIPQLQLDPTQDNSILPAFGFTELQTINLWYVEAKAAESFLATRPPAMVFLAPAQTEIPVFLESAPPTAGFCRIELEGKVEILRYSSAPTFDFYNQLAYYLQVYDSVTELSWRGRMGTDPLPIAIPATLSETNVEGVWSTSALQTVKVTILGGIEDATLSELIGTLLTNESGAGPWYDPAQPEGYAGAIPHYLVDDETLDAIGQDGLIGTEFLRRNYTWSDPLQLSDLLGGELAAMGLTLQARWRTSDRTYRLCVDQVRLPLVIAGQSITAADVIHSRPVEIMQQTSACINACEVKLEPPGQVGKAGVEFRFRWQDSIDRLRKAQSESYTIGGLANVQTIQPQNLAAHFLSLLASYAYPFEIVTMPLRRQFWTLQPGQQVAVTMPGAPNPRGGRGWTNEAMIVLGVTRNYLPETGEPPCMATMLHTLGTRLSYWSPCAKVTAYDAGTTTITCADNEFSQAGPWLLDQTKTEKDLRWFETAGYVRLIQQDTDSSAVEMSVASVDADAGTVVLSAAPATDPVAGDYITFPTWDNRSVFEKDFVAIADALETLGTANDPTFQYA